MEEMKLLSKTLMECKSFKERQKRLNESIDYLSFNCTELYCLLYREFKKREKESNDPNKISTWLNNPNCYVKLHEALILVKNDNFMAKDEYINSLKRMLCHTIENGTNLYETVKICRLIEKSTHLKSIYDHLKYLIQRVHQLCNNRHYNCIKFQPNNLWENDFNRVQDSMETLNIKSDQPLHYSMLQPGNSILSHGRSHFELNCYDRPEISATANRHSYFCPAFDVPQSTCLSLTIIDQGMDGVFSKWLRYLKLHKYQWFFNGLSYHEIESIDEENIVNFILKVNKNTIARGAQKKICISIKTLRNRKQKLNDLLTFLDLEVSNNELCEVMNYMRDMLHCPIPNKNCVIGDQLQQNIVCIMEKLYNQLIEKLHMTRTLAPESLLGNSINKFLECAKLISGNQIFMKRQVYKTSILAEKLIHKIHSIP